MTANRVCALTVFALSAFGPATFADINVPGREPVGTVDFERHVMPLFSKAGCNGGSCHGSFQGKNGFRLSLFGFDPDKDFAWLTRDHLGRRVNPVSPDDSVLLSKASGRIPHDGGVRLTKGSWQYAILREWIAAGATWSKGRGVVRDLVLDSPEYVFVPVKGQKQITVRAKYEQGPDEIVTAFCDFRINDDAVADIDGYGHVKANKPGDTGLTISYRGIVKAVRVLVPATLPAGATYPTVPEVNFIDREVLAKLRKLNMVPSELSSDTEFLRRVTIDTIGNLPTPDEVRKFLADTSPDKRTRKVEELLAHPLHAALWATKFSDITGNATDMLEQPQQLKPKRSQQWHDWLRKRVQDNVPYDHIVRDILTATSREGRTPEEWIEQTNKSDAALEKGFDESYRDRKTLDLFWRRQGQVQLEQWGEKVAVAFLGVRLECAQCHKHPTDRWTQADYRAFANLFAQVAFNLSPEVRPIAQKVNDERKSATEPKNANRLNTIKELYLANVSSPAAKGKNANPKAQPKGQPGKVLTHPETNQPLTPKALGGPEMPLEAGKDVRGTLFGWMRSPTNPYFARSFVNRVWAHYLGIGLVEPVDDFSVANPPTNARLLDALAQEFIDHDYDMRHLERTILASRTYQVSSTPNATNKYDKNNYARGYVRPVMAEVVVDMLNAALGVSESLGTEAPAGAKMIEIGATRIQNGNLSYVLRIFGKSARTSACDCERTMEPALPQTLYRMTDPAIMQKLTTAGNRVNQLVKAKTPDSEAVEELFLATLSRPPTELEREAFARYAAKAPNRNAALTDAVWALINTREFILNH
ncbi:MAG: DUF1549 and DUF1553 domain-containing protein [Gemmataceae bacterium]